MGETYREIFIDDQYWQTELEIERQDKQLHFVVTETSQDPIHCNRVIHLTYDLKIIKDNVDNILDMISNRHLIDDYDQVYENRMFIRNSLIIKSNETPLYFYYGEFDLYQWTYVNKDGNTKESAPKFLHFYIFDKSKYDRLIKFIKDVVENISQDFVD